MTTRLEIATALVRAIKSSGVEVEHPWGKPWETDPNATLYYLMGVVKDITIDMKAKGGSNWQLITKKGNQDDYSPVQTGEVLGKLTEQIVTYSKQGDNLERAGLSPASIQKAGAILFQG